MRKKKNERHMTEGARQQNYDKHMGKGKTKTPKRATKGEKKKKKEKSPEDKVSTNTGAWLSCHDTWP